MDNQPLVDRRLAVVGAVGSAFGACALLTAPSAGATTLPSAAPLARLPATGLPSTGLPATGLPSTGLPATGLPSTGLPAATSAGLTNALRAYLRTRTGIVGLHLHDHRSGRDFSYNSFTNQTLSTVKVLILATVLRRSQETGRALTASQRALAARMICYSDNSATDSLLAQVGVAQVQRSAPGCSA